MARTRAALGGQTAGGDSIYFATRNGQTVDQAIAALGRPRRYHAEPTIVHPMVTT